MEGRSSSSFYKSRLCKVLVLLGFFWFLLVGVVDTQRTTAFKVMARFNPQLTGFRRLEGVIAGQRRSSKHRKRLEQFNFVSKRRVPNGPDPIHNRRAGNSNQPPGRSQRTAAAIKGRRQ